MSDEVNRRQAHREHLHRRAQDDHIECVERPDLPHAPLERALVPGKQTLVEATQVRAEPGKHTLAETADAARLAVGRPGLTEVLAENSVDVQVPFETHIAKARDAIVALDDANASRDVLRSSAAIEVSEIGRARGPSVANSQRPDLLRRELPIERRGRGRVTSFCDTSRRTARSCACKPRASVIGGAPLGSVADRFYDDLQRCLREESA